MPNSPKHNSKNCSNWRKKNPEKYKAYYLKYNKHIQNNKKELRLLSTYRSIDKKKNLSNDLTVEWIKDNILSKSCVYCGTTDYLGCDRIDNTKGHTKENCIPCCKDCNFIRRNSFTVEEMLIIGGAIRTIHNMRKINGNNNS